MEEWDQANAGGVQLTRASERLDLLSMTSSLRDCDGFLEPVGAAAVLPPGGRITCLPLVAGRLNYQNSLFSFQGLLTGKQSSC